MASQTTYYGGLQKPEIGGDKLTVVTGTHKFTSSATIVTLTVPFKNEVVGVYLSWKTRPATRKGKALWTTAVISSKAIKVQRATGSSSGMTFWYKLVGW